MENKIKIHPLNVRGRYYVDQETCIIYDCCCAEAPNNFRTDENTNSAYVFKQPENAEEELQCKMAMDVCPVFAIYDDGI